MGPTEFVHLEAKQLYEDFNFIKPDRSWIHLEFESDGIREEDLRRFRSYEAVTAFIRRVDNPDIWKNSGLWPPNGRR